MIFLTQIKKVSETSAICVFTRFLETISFKNLFSGYENSNT